MTSISPTPLMQYDDQTKVFTFGQLRIPFSKAKSCEVLADCLRIKSDTFHPEFGILLDLMCETAADVDRCAQLLLGKLPDQELMPKHRILNYKIYPDYIVVQAALMNPGLTDDEVEEPKKITQDLQAGIDTILSMNASNLLQMVNAVVAQATIVPESIGQILLDLEQRGLNPVSNEEFDQVIETIAETLSLRGQKLDSEPTCPVDKP